MKHLLVFVDDEKSVLNSLRRSLRGSEHDIEYFEEPAKALEFIKTREPSVIISDMRMPVMNGAVFLSECLKVCPDSVRMILSGFSEQESLTDAINQAKIWNFLSKPWNRDDLLLTLQSAIEIYESRAARICLMKELEQKNAELEQRVKERTAELEDRAKILHCLLDSDNANDALNMIRDSILRMTSAEDVQIISGDAPKGSYPVSRGERVIGGLKILAPKRKDPETRTKLERLLPVLGIALSFLQTENSGDDILKSLDRLIEGLK